MSVGKDVAARNRPQRVRLDVHTDPAALAAFAALNTALVAAPAPATVSPEQIAAVQQQTDQMISDARPRMDAFVAMLRASRSPTPSPSPSSSSSTTPQPN